ncbi:MAG: transposase domain-containing protein [Planctomycetaceae bacterium]
MLAISVLTDLPIRQVFRHSRRSRRGELAPGRSSLCEARQRLGAEPLRKLHAAIARPLATRAFYREWRLMGMDGSVSDLPGSEANAVF